jgi:acetylornithine/N-succinyldiaminopimelate aminotransferase
VTSHLLPTYARVDLAFERGEGAWLIATNGERYLDFTGGVAVNALGHAHPYLIDALSAQAHRLWHVSNLFRIPEAERLAERLCAATFADLVFFCNSGAEAMECAIKVARKYQFASGGRSVTASLRSKAHSTGVRSRRSPPADRKNTSKGSAP